MSGNNDYEKEQASNEVNELPVIEGRAEDIAELLTKVDQWYDQAVLRGQVQAYLASQRMVLWSRSFDLVRNVDGATDWLLGEMQKVARFVEAGKAGATMVNEVENDE